MLADWCGAKVLFRVSFGKPAVSIEASLIFLCLSKETAGQHLDYVIIDSLQIFLQLIVN